VSKQSLGGALAFIEQAQLPGYTERVSRDASEKNAGELAGEISASTSVVVGSEILSFDGVPGELRGPILNCTLLAQLVANTSVPNREDLDSWYEQYFDALMKLGWAVEFRGLTDLRLTGEELKVHDAVLTVASAFLGETSSGLTLVVAALKALRKMDEKQPWLKLFNRETYTQKAARFQIGVASGSATNLTISSMVFALSSSTEITQILFFREATSKSRFRERHGRTAIDLEILKGIQGALSKKLALKAADYIRSLPDLP
jgi:hypothetical protein